MSHGSSQLENRDWNIKQSLKVTGNFRESPDRYVLTESFKKLPVLNTNVAYTVNTDFEVLGTNAVAGDVTRSATIGGIEVQTHGADNDSTIVLPHLDTGLSSWTGCKWGTENKVIFEAQVRTGAAVTTVLYWVGLKLTNAPTIATDDDQVYFRFSTDDSNTTWRCIDSIADSDTNTDSGVTVSAATNYDLRIEIDEDRKAHFFIDDSCVHVSGALTNDKDFVPYIGCQQLAGAITREIYVVKEKISRIVFE